MLRISKKIIIPDHVFARWMLFFIFLVIIFMLTWGGSDSISDYFYNWRIKACSRNNVAKVIKSIVKIDGQEASGSGFWIRPDIVLTNNHVVFLNDDLKVIDYSDERQEFSAKVLFTDPVHDLALLKVGGANFKPLSFRQTKPQVLEDVYALGFPLARNLTITRGIISAITTDDFDDRIYIQTDATVNSGNSGGPLVDACGQVIGINTSGLQDADNINFATISSQVEERVKEMIIAGEKNGQNPSDLATMYQNQYMETVAKYYYTLGEGKIKEAYDYYSFARQQLLPYDYWSELWNDTLFVRLKSVEPTEEIAKIKVDFIVTDAVTDADGYWVVVSKEHQGTWKLIQENGAWKLNEADIQKTCSNIYYNECLDDVDFEDNSTSTPNEIINPQYKF